MRKLAFLSLALLLLVGLNGPARAQERHMFTAWEWLTADKMREIIDDVIPRIEAYTGMRFRRDVTLIVQPRAQWEAGLERTGFAGMSARHALAFYTPSVNSVTAVPWVIGGAVLKKPPKRTADEWLAQLQPTLIHEMTHALQHQNFHSEGRWYVASLGTKGLTEEQIDRSTVQFILSEGFAELVSLRTTDYRGQRQPESETNTLRAYMRKYVPDKKGRVPFRVLLSRYGYQDGLTLLHHLSLKGGMYAVRSVLYRNPPRELLFLPEVQGAIETDVPPEPDDIFRMLHPGPLSQEGVLLATNPGKDRFFDNALNGHAKGCLIGYMAHATSGAYADAKYAFYVTDPDRPGKWSEEQVESLKARNPGDVTESEHDLPYVKGVKAKVLIAENKGGARVLRAEADGLVVLMAEESRTPQARTRLLYALSALYFKRPKPDLYKAVIEKVRAGKSGASE